MVNLSTFEIENEVRDARNKYYYCCSISTLLVNDLSMNVGCTWCPYNNKKLKSCRKYLLVQRVFR